MATNYKMPEGATAVLQEGPIPFHFRGWDLQSNTVVIVNNMQAVQTRSSQLEAS